MAFRSQFALLKGFHTVKPEIPSVVPIEMFRVFHPIDFSLIVPEIIYHHDVEEIRFRGFVFHGPADLCVVGILHIQ